MLYLASVPHPAEHLALLIDAPSNISIKDRQSLSVLVHGMCCSTHIKLLKIKA